MEMFFLGFLAGGFFMFLWQVTTLGLRRHDI